MDIPVFCKPLDEGPFACFDPLQLKEGLRMSTVDSVAADQLRSIIERIEKLEEEKTAIAQDIKDVYGEAKANGYDTKVLRKIVSLRKRDAAERQEEEAILDLYLQALGMAS